jgi:isoamylase
LKLIAEPWDLGPDGYRLGTFPPPWAEWNGAFRSGIRDFWRGRASAIELKRRMQGSGDLFGSRGPWASINYVTAHDGFTLADLVSYNEKHNQANPEENRDGSDDNRSWNCGAEGPTDNEFVNSLRRRQQRNFLTTLLLSRGVPMLLAGDELGRTQHGNNNAWCQDNELSWIDWNLGENELRLLAFTQHLTRMRRTIGAQDFGWFRPDGEELGSDESTERRSAVAALTASASGGSLLLLFNSQSEPVVFKPPVDGSEQLWTIELSTADPDSEGPEQPSGRGITVGDRSIVVLRHP